MEGYTGISFPFRFGGNGGVQTSTTNIDDLSHINESIAQIILTKLGERYMEVDFGSEAHKQLFSDLDDETELAVLKFYIMDALEKWETRITVDDVILEQKIDSNKQSYMECTVIYEVIKYMIGGSTTVSLYSEDSE